jgi:hypothetical protein
MFEKRKPQSCSSIQRLCLINIQHHRCLKFALLEACASSRAAASPRSHSSRSPVGNISNPSAARRWQIKILFCLDTAGRASAVHQGNQPTDVSPNNVAG